MHARAFQAVLAEHSNLADLLASNLFWSPAWLTRLG